MQSRRLSLIEASLNVTVGLVVSFLLQVMLFGALGIRANLGQNIAITAAFTMLSLIRSYVLRRWFNRMLPAAFVLSSEAQAGEEA